MYKIYCRIVRDHRAPCVCDRPLLMWKIQVMIQFITINTVALKKVIVEKVTAFKCRHGSILASPKAQKIATIVGVVAIVRVSVS